MIINKTQLTDFKLISQTMQIYVLKP